MLFICFAVPCTIAQEIEDDPIIPEEQVITFSTIRIEKQESLEPYYEALKTATFGTQRFSIFEQLAEHHSKTGNTDSILHYATLYEKEIGNWDKPEDDKNRNYAKAHYFMGVGSSFNGIFDKAIEWHIKGIQAANTVGAKEYEYRNKIGLARANLKKINSDKAIAISEEALAEFALEFKPITNEALIILGDAHLQKKNYGQAETYYEEAKEMAQSQQDLETELAIRLKQGQLAEGLNDIDKAMADYETIRNLALKEGFTAIYFEGTLLLGKLYFKEGYYEQANIALSFAYINAIDRENLEFQRDALSVQARCYAKMNDYENGYAVITQLLNVIGEINSKQQQTIIKELEVQYETVEKEQEITSLEEAKIVREAELSRQKTIKNAFLIGFFIILIPIMALLYTYYQKIQAQSELSKKQEEINAQKVAALKQEQELNLIKASIEGQDEERKRIAQELHDSIGGNLAGIKLQLASMDDNSTALSNIGSQLDETYQLVRDISHTLIPKKFKQNAFTKLVAEYVKSISGTGELTIGFHPYPEKLVNQIDENIQMELFKVIQELMTNTLKHADATNVEIHLNVIGEELSLLFEDNGKGFDVEKTSKGIGSDNIQHRVAQLNGQLSIDSQLERGTVVAIEIPIKPFQA
ncbi:histidine kinase [Aggregatimonas sangjinii]|uniref:histidine kinase n=2 Tax=Aggregatimonas sangjinii TaxID=2583587 RepID=A0A5B7SUQ5_9FLAO|nr:histidine kinase [Aggregatimonas sangjinii]